MKHISTLLFAACMAATAHGLINLTNWSIVGDTLTFDLSGSIEPDASIGGGAPSFFYIGDPGNVGWVLGQGSVVSITEHGGSNSTFLPSTGEYSDYASGNYVSLTKSVGDWAPGDTVNATFTISGGSLNGAGIAPEDIIVAAGANSFGSPFPDVSTKVGGYVPEPTTWAAFAGLAALGVAYLPRKR